MGSNLAGMTVAANPVDPVTTEVIASRVREIAATMEHVLYHSGYSTILRESKDGSAGLTDADGRVVIVGGGLQYHALPYQRAVESVLARYPREALQPGDSFVVNDPYHGGNPHVPDFVALTPGFYDGVPGAPPVLIGWGVSIAHKTDVGGLVPGSSGAGAREIYHDGMLIPPVRYQTNAGINEIVEAVIRSNSRTPDVVLGDLRGQVGATRLGVERLANLCSEYGRETVTAVMADILARTGRRLREEIAAWPDGTAEAEGFLDHDGAVPDRPVRIHARVTVRGDRLTIDFSDSDAQTQGPVNANATTVESCSLLAVLAALDPTIPVNCTDVPDRVQLRALGTREAQPGAGDRAVRPRQRRHRRRVSQIADRQADRAIRADDDLPRRYGARRRCADRDGDDAHHPEHAGRGARDRVRPADAPV
jgi:N-methylhydantoinase B